MTTNPDPSVHRAGGPRAGTNWLMPAVAGLSMWVPVKLWDLALERELSQVAIRRICEAQGLRPSAGAVAACNSRIFRALTRGFRGSWAVSGALVASYLAAPMILNGVLAAGYSHLTQRIVQHHLTDGHDLESLTEDRIRETVHSLLRPATAANRS